MTILDVSALFEQAKNLYVSERERMRPKEVIVDTESSSTETSTTESDTPQESREELRKTKTQNIEAIKGTFHFI